MLTDIVQPRLALGVRPQPALAAVEPGAALAAARRVPEGDRHVVTVHPLPTVWILWVADCPHPVLTAAVAPTNQILDVNNKIKIVIICRCYAFLFFFYMIKNYNQNPLFCKINRLLLPYSEKYKSTIIKYQVHKICILRRYALQIHTF